jgi:cold shock CspA family protein
MRLFNNTKFDKDFVLEFVKPHCLYVQTQVLPNKPGQYIESIAVEEGDGYQFKIIIYGEECVLWEGLSNNTHQVEGTVRWFDQISGEGSIRLGDGDLSRSIHFFSCNFNGANSQYPQLVTNVQLKDGQRVKATLCPDMFKDLGLINLEVIS